MIYSDVDTCIQDISDSYDVLGIIDCDLYKDSWVELYIELEKFYQTTFSDSQRIIIKTTFDYFKDDTHGIILQSLQTILNNIDISNFFVCLVTTNKNVLNEYQHVLKTYSVDPVSINLYICDGGFQQKSTVDIKAFTKLQDLSSVLEVVKSVSDSEKRLLFNSETFCIAPWTSLMISTNNVVRPCCEFKGEIGNLKKSSLEEIWNNDEIKNVRKQMINNLSVEGCKSCYLNESYGRDSLRNSLNRRFASHIKKINNTNQEGYVDNFELVYLDSRFNNLCNLSCRSCGHTSSSSWHKPAVKLGIIASDTPIFLKAGQHKNDLLNQIKQHIQSIERIYFAGGEPLIIEEFYQILDELHRVNRTDVELIYNTNLTQFKLKDRSIFDLWKDFSKISIGASLDGEGCRGEYLRCGTKWQDVLNFRQKMINERPDIDFYISATTGLINALHIPDFHKSWVEKKLIQPEQFNVHLLFTPSYMNINTAPLSLRKKIIEKYCKHLDWLRPLDKLGRATAGFKSIISHLDHEVEFDHELFWNKVDLLDGYYKTNLLTTFPELEELK